MFLEARDRGQAPRQGSGTEDVPRANCRDCARAISPQVGDLGIPAWDRGQAPIQERFEDPGSLAGDDG